MKRILIIEDDPDQRTLLKTILDKAGYEVLEASNGKEGLRLFRQQSCDLVITDIFMAEEDGIETIIDLKTQKTGVKIVAVSGGGRWSKHGHTVRAEEPLEIAKQVGAHRILKKPYKIKQMVDLVNDLLNQVTVHLPSPGDEQPSS